METLPTGEELIGIEFIDDVLTLVGRFFPERGTLAATVRTPLSVYVLTGTP